jgi:DNA-binding response OmpR family regulator
MTDDRPSSQQASSQGGRKVKAALSHLRHDLRTPVNAIIGYGEMLLEDVGPTAPPEIAAALRKLPELGGQLLAGINHLLDSEKIEAAGDSLDLVALGSALHARLQGPTDATVQTADGLIDNAAKAGLDDIIPDVERIREAGCRLMVMLDQTNDLASLSPPVTPGSPVASTPTPRPAASQLAETEPAIRGHLLVVDDNDFNRDILGRAVTRQGHTFAEAPDGETALAAVQSEPFDLVLLDVNMPGLDGMQVLQQIKGDLRFRHIPVIMISATDEIATVVRCIEMGAEDYLPKPFDPVLLKARIGACLEKKRRRDQELEYLRNVAAITAAVGSMETGALNPESIKEVAAREDALGKLARMLQHTAREVQAREERLKQEVQALKVEIDHSRKAHQVAEVTETSYFKDLQDKVKQLRKRREGM